MPVSSYRKSRNGPLRGLERVNAYNPLKGLQVRVTHPKQIGLLATCLSALAGSFFFVALLNIGTALFVQICTINEVGPATGVCSYVPSPPNAAQIGNHPEYTLLSILLVFGDREMLIFGSLFFVCLRPWL
jgi:hypothetical protein